MVYVVQGTDLGKFHKADRYGDLVPMLHRDVFPDDVEKRIEVMKAILEAKLHNFNPAKDFLLLTGDPIAIALSVLILSCSTLTIQCLKWDREIQDYYPVTLEI